jgi:hypothetical protein
VHPMERKTVRMIWVPERRRIVSSHCINDVTGDQRSQSFLGPDGFDLDGCCGLAGTRCARDAERSLRLLNFASGTHF